MAKRRATLRGARRLVVSLCGFLCAFVRGKVRKSVEWTHHTTL